jgi:TRAP-type C4-dicarboxylate transport system permease small subunit
VPDVGRTRELLYQFEKSLSGGLLAVLSATILAQVVSRFVLNLPLAWSEEVSRYSFIWLTMIGAPICIRLKANLSMDVLGRRLPDRGALILEFSTYLLVLILLAVMLVWGAKILTVVKQQYSPAIGIPMYWVYAAIPVGAFLMIIEICFLIDATVRKLKTVGEMAR